MPQVLTASLRTLLLGAGSALLPISGLAEPSDEAIVTVRTPVGIEAKQQLPYFVGISAETAGAKGLSMSLVIIPAGAAARPHYHKGYESAIYLLEGRVETRYGAGLTKSVKHQAGDFILIPPGVPHQPRNLSTTQRAVAIVARNDPREQDNVVPYDPEP